MFAQRVKRQVASLGCEEVPVIGTDLCARLRAVGGRSRRVERSHADADRNRRGAVVESDLSGGRGPGGERDDQGPEQAGLPTAAANPVILTIR